MSDIKLFRFNSESVEELPCGFASLERDLQIFVEKHLEDFFGVRFLAHEYGTGRSQRGQIDTLGIDENCCPVIIEFKRRHNENVITQALYYLDWLLDHQAEFASLAEKKLGSEVAGKIEFSWIRLLCVASDFSRFDERAVARIEHPIELIRYKYFGEDILLLEKLNSSISPFLREAASEDAANSEGGAVGMPVALQTRVKAMNSEIELIYLDLLSFAESLGEDVSIKFLKHYIAMTRLKNFTCVQPYKTFIKLWLNLDPEEVPPEDGFSRDVRNVGHHASGNFEIDLRNQEDLEKAKPFIELAYNKN